MTVAQALRVSGVTAITTLARSLKYIEMEQPAPQLARTDARKIAIVAIRPRTVIWLLLRASFLAP